MINDFVYYRNIKDNIEPIRNSFEFDNYMDFLYHKIDDFIIETINNDEYKKSVENKFKNSNEENINIDKIIIFFQNNPIDMYNYLLSGVSFIKHDYEKRNNLTDTNNIKYYKVISKYKNKIRLIENEYNLKFESGYFNKEVK